MRGGARRTLALIERALNRPPDGPRKRYASILAIVVALVLIWAQGRGVFETGGTPADLGPQAERRGAPRAGAESGSVARAYAARQSDVQVAGTGVVTRVLPDDNDGSRHQRFILRLADGQTVLVAHNVDLAPRVVGLALGDKVSFYGEYEFNESGGVIHWTHHDPAGRHPIGFLEHAGRKFQ